MKDNPTPHINCVNVSGVVVREPRFGEKSGRPFLRGLLANKQDFRQDEAGQWHHDTYFFDFLLTDDTAADMADRIHKDTHLYVAGVLQSVTRGGEEETHTRLRILGRNVEILNEKQH